MVGGDVASDRRAPRSRVGDRAWSTRMAGSVAAASPDDSVGEEPLPRRGPDGTRARGRHRCASLAGGAATSIDRRAGARGRALGASLAPGGSRRRRGAAPARALPPMVVAAGAGQTPGGAQVHRLSGRDRSRTTLPDDVEYVPMTGQGDRGARLPLGEGQHVFECGGTGTGKTTTARRLLAARTLAHGAGAMLIDQEGEPEDEEQLRRIAAAAGRPFVLFDPRDPDTDRWQPLWGAPADGAARAVEPIKKSEPYYADVLRQDLNLLVDAARSNRYETICDLATGLGNEHRMLKRRVEEHAEWVSSRDGKKDLAGGLVRLELVMGAAWREVLTPRFTPDGDAVAVGLVAAIQAGAVV